MKSPTLEQMITEKKGYRTENYGGSGVRDVYDIIRHEISMGNTDIIQYVQNQYHILKEYGLDKKRLSEEDKKFILELEGEERFEEALEEAEYDTLCEVIQENAPSIADEIIDYIEKQFPPKSYYGLWLTTKDDVLAYYNGNQTDGIDEYEIPNEFIVLSDLDDEGSLFVFKK